MEEEEKKRMMPEVRKKAREKYLKERKEKKMVCSLFLNVVGVVCVKCACMCSACLVLLGGGSVVMERVCLCGAYVYGCVS